MHPLPWCFCPSTYGSSIRSHSGSLFFPSPHPSHHEIPVVLLSNCSPYLSISQYPAPTVSVGGSLAPSALRIQFRSHSVADRSLLRCKSDHSFSSCPLPRSVRHLCSNECPATASTKLGLQVCCSMHDRSISLNDPDSTCLDCCHKVPLKSWLTEQLLTVTFLGAGRPRSSKVRIQQDWCFLGLGGKELFEAPLPAS